MSLAIKTNEISDVLIDKWYKVNVFDTDAFEIGYNSDSLGKFDLTYQPTNDDSTGFIFKDINNEIIVGPMSSIKAFKIKENK
jgi:hypothetical protein